MSGCVRNIRTKNYQNLIICFQVTAKNVGDVFFGTQCRIPLVYSMGIKSGMYMHSVNWANKHFQRIIASTDAVRAVML